jgi:flagellar basal-body rod protein FlgG
MNIAFYNSAVGAMQQQKNLDITSNNIANVNTEGYRGQSGAFVDMMYSKIHDPNEEDLTVGSGARIDHTKLNYAWDFSQGGVESTDNPYDFAINGTGFFAVYNLETQEVSYTRKGMFQLSEYGSNMFYLTTDSGEFVLGPTGQAISVDSEGNVSTMPGVYDFDSYDGFQLCGDVLFQPSEKDGQPFLNEDAEVMQGYVEKSNTSLANEMTKVIEAQRAYQANLRMITTADQIEQTVNSLR